MRTPWAVVLCKFSDHAEEPQPVSFFQNYITAAGRGMGGAFDYFWDQSYGAADLSGSQVFGWYTLDHTLAQDGALSRFDRIMRGIQAAQAQGRVDFTPFYGILVMLNAAVDSGSVGQVSLTLSGVTKVYGLTVLDLLAWTASWAGHEMGHGFGLSHSWSAGTPDAEYGDPYDIMSAFTFGGRDSTFPGPHFGGSGPGLIGPYREQRGWLAEDRIYWHSQLGDNDHPSVGMNVLQEAGSPGWLMTKIYKQAADPYNFWTAEYRRRTGWDLGLPGDRVVVHEVRPNGLAYYLAALADGQTFDAGTGNLHLHARGVGAPTAVVDVQRPGSREFYYDSGPGTLDPGQSVEWSWWFGTAPTLLHVMPIPGTADVGLQCGELRSLRNDDGTVTYSITVTNRGTARATYHLAAQLTR